MVFQSAIAGGDDWRQVARGLLSQLPDTTDANFAFLYITDELANDAGRIFKMLRRATGIRHWLGGSNLAAFSQSGYLHGEPGAVMMIGHVPDGSLTHPDAALEALQKYTGGFGLIHGDPRMLQLPRNLQLLAELPMFWSGGLTLNRGGHRVFHGDQSTHEEICLSCFDERTQIASVLFQGCRPFGDVHTITASDGPMLLALDHRPAMEVFAHDLERLIETQGAFDPRSEDIHVGLLNAASDRGDYAVRGLSSINPEQEFLNVAANLESGQRMQFVQRSAEFAHQDMQSKLEQLMTRLRSQGQRPVAAHYVSCMGRVPGLFNAQVGEEMDYLRAALGDIPIIGYYGLGEIMRGELHNFAGVLTVFLEN